MIRKIRLIFFISITLVLFACKIDQGLQSGDDILMPQTSVSRLQYDIWVDSTNHFNNFEAIHTQAFERRPDIKLEEPKHAYWVHFSLKNDSSIAHTYWLHVGVFDSLSLVKAEKNQIDHRGLLIEYEDNQKALFQGLHGDKYGFEIHLEPNCQQDYYLRIKNIVRFESLLSGIRLQKVEDKIQSSAKSTIYFMTFSAAFFSIILFFILFSLFQFVQNKDEAYLYYAIYLGLCAFYFWWKFEKSNSIINFLFTQSPAFYYYFEIPLCILIYISYFLFCIHFLNAKKELPSFYRILKIWIPPLLVYLIFNIVISFTIGLSASWEMNYWLRFILIPFSLFAIFQVLKAKHQLAFYILSGTSVLIISATITTIFSKSFIQHYFGPWDIPLLPVQIGMLIEIMFFSTGLAYKSRLAVQEKTSILLDLKQQEKDTLFHKKRREELSKLYVNLSHEFRTPLTVIMGALGQIKGSQKEKGLIRRNGEQLLSLINRILDLNKLEADKMELHWEQGDVIGFIRYCIEPFELLAKKKKQSFELFCATKKLIIDFDSEKLQEIINNLVSNAVKFTPKGGKIRIDVYEQKLGREPYLHLDVSDSGPGISKEYHQFIFDYYTQLPQTDGGTGIGLALVKELTDLLGGNIKLKSELGKGASFCLRFPIHRFAPLAGTPNYEISHSESIQDTAPLQLVSGRLSILLVEDNQDVQTYMKHFLSTNYNVFSAQNGVHALELFRQTRPDIIISDIMMPEMDGYELCKKLKSDIHTQHIPIILISAKASKRDLLCGLASEADAYLVKPFDEQELLLRIKQLLQKTKVLSSHSENAFSPQQMVAKEEPQIVLFMEKFHRILQENLKNESFKIAELCHALGMNHVSINNKIKSFSGQTTAQYIRNYRLNLAKALLKGTDLSIAEVSYEIGVSEPANFNNMFKKAFGQSPKQWKSS